MTNHSTHTEDLCYWVGLSKFPKFGALKIKKLMNYFPDMASAYWAEPAELKNAGLAEKTIEQFLLFRSQLDLEAEMVKLEREDIKIVTLKDKFYPSLLKECYDAPALLYCRGHLTTEEFNLAVVGTRKISIYGEQVTPLLVDGLTKAGLTIVSGLALGVDALAHKTALAANGRTIGVLGCGIDWSSIYPSTNRYLAQKIIDQGGLLLSEFPLATPPLKHHFPFRNRIIAGLSLGTLVIEAPLNSGALLTAKQALDYNREVFAVPNSILHSTSQGTNQLLKLGAKVVTQAVDVLEALNLQLADEYKTAQQAVPESETERKLLTALSQEPKQIDELVRTVKLKPQEVSAALTLMEMKGKVRHLGGTQYVLAP